MQVRQQYRVAVTIQRSGSDAVQVRQLYREAAAMPCSRRQQYRESAVLRRCETVNAVQRAAIYFRLWQRAVQRAAIYFRLWQRWLHVVPQPTVVYLYFYGAVVRPTPYEKNDNSSFLQLFPRKDETFDTSWPEGVVIFGNQFIPRYMFPLFWG